MGRVPSEGQVLETEESRTLPDADDADDADDGARQAGIDAAVLDRLLSAMDPGDRSEIRTLCASDLERTRQGAAEALERWNAEALERHLHVMSSLAATVGADALADEARRMQVRLRSGATTGYEESARRMNELAQRAARFLGKGAK